MADDVTVPIDASFVTESWAVLREATRVVGGRDNWARISPNEARCIREELHRANRLREAYRLATAPRTPPPAQEVVEAVAQSIYAARPFVMGSTTSLNGVSIGKAFDWDGAPDYYQSEMRDLARAALAALSQGRDALVGALREVLPFVQQAADEDQPGAVSALMNAEYALKDATQ